jgi:hypothetical protein
MFPAKVNAVTKPQHSSGLAQQAADFICKLKVQVPSILEKGRMRPGMVVHACNPSYSGSRDRRQV